MKATSWVIRPARRHDIAALLALEQALPTAPHWPEAAYVAACEDGQQCLFVAERAGEMAGFAAAAVVCDEAELLSVAVAPAHQRYGVGEALIRATQTWAVQADAQTMLLEVRSGSATAIRLYARLGFVQVGLRRGYYHHPEEDAVLMRWSVPSDGSTRSQGEM